MAQERLLLSKENFVRVVSMILSLFGIVTLYLRHSRKSAWLNEDLPYEVLNFNSAADVV
jgi:hypothetical protein